MKQLATTPLSVLDLVTYADGTPLPEAFKNSRRLAQCAERWGYRRYWVAEHHNLEGIASSATVVLMGYLAEATTTIRIGSGGIMLPNHAPFIVAEQIGTLESIYPRRIDLGLGRAPGTDPLTMRALRRHSTGAEFDREVLELMSYFAPLQEGQKVKAIPGAGLEIPIWILGSSTYSAHLAAALGYGVVADREPHLGEVSLLQVVGGAGAAHPGGHPAWVHRVAGYVGPAPGDNKSEGGHEQLAVAVGLDSVPPAGRPVQVSQAVVAAAVHAAGEVDEPVRALDQAGQQVRRQGVDRQRPRMPLRARMAVAVGVHARVVDDRVHPAQLVDLIGEPAGLFSAGEVTDDHGCPPLGKVSNRGRTVRVADVNDHLMTLIDQVRGGRHSQALGGAGHQDPSHQKVLLPACDQSPPHHAEVRDGVPASAQRAPRRWLDCVRRRGSCQRRAEPGV